LIPDKCREVIILADLFGGVEAGGTKFVCMIGTGPDDIKAEVQFPTTDPVQTLNHVIEFFNSKQKEIGKVTAVGIGSFGPVDINERSSSYGYITSPPKFGWANTNILGIIKNELQVPVYFDTDVNCAALGEYRWGSARGINNFIYITVGTGIGGSAFVGGKVLHGKKHPEIGHMRVPHDRQEDPYDGCCSFHGDCLEGLASGPAISKRWNINANELPDDHPAWQQISKYLALAVYNLICAFSPDKIMIGGGVLKRKQLYAMIQKRVLEIDNKYIQPTSFNDVGNYIVAPGLGHRSGVLGSIALAATGIDCL
jgi:fructokinase